MAEIASNAARFTLSIEGAGGRWSVVRWQGTEGLSSLYQFKVEALVEDPPSPRSLLGANALLTIHDTGGERHVHGIVAAASEGRQGLRERHMEVVIAPRAWRLLYSVDCRIFQQKTVAEIIAQVLSDHDIAGADVRFALQGAHPAHEYCVQYRESDWAFISRLCEEEGIYLFFEHTDSNHTLVFADAPGAHPLISGDAHVPLHDPSGAVASSASVSALWATARIGVGRVRLQDFNFVQPALDLGSDAAGSAYQDLEFYDHPGGHESLAAGRRSARVRLEEQAWQQHTARGRSDCPRLVPGFRFTLDDLDGALREDLRCEYVVTSVTHHGAQSAARGDGSAVTAPEYVNEFEVIPSSVPYRPLRATPRPVIHGVQTAIVVGPGGQEIYTDPHGRVKVHFHWDRVGGRNERSSCWIRVSQAWAGQGYGFIAIPRIGHEVIVSFVEGDPDRPLITGRVYHGTNPVPYDLPGNMTRTTLKSNSSPGGDGSNELRFEDMAGSEEVYLHAQKDWNVVTEHDKSQRTGHDESLTIGHDRAKDVAHDQREHVGHDKTIRVDNDHTEEIGANCTITVGAHHVERVGASRQEDIAENATLDVGGDSTTEVRGNMSLTVLQTKQEQVLLASQESVGLAKAVEVGAAYSISVGAAYSVSVVGSAGLSAGGSISESAKADVSITAGGDITAHSKANTQHEADGEMSVRAKKDLSVATEKKMAFTAADEVSVTCGSASVVIKKNGEIVVKGGKVTVEGSSNVVIKGSRVALN